MTRKTRKTEPQAVADSSDENKLLGPVEAARFLRVSLSSIQRWIDSGAIPAHRTFGGHRRMLEHDLVAFAEREGIPLSPANNEQVLLVVDDDEDYLESLVVRIQGLRPDLEILTAMNGFDAGRLVHQRRPALVLLDIKLPGVNGIEVCRALKSEPETKGTHIVGMTGAARKSEIDALILAGAEDVLAKPIRKDVLLEIINQCIPIAVSAKSAGRKAASR